MTKNNVHICSPVILLLFCLAGCASHTQQPQTAWDLSPSAEASFSYLKFQTLKQDGKTKQALEALETSLKILPSPYLFLEKADLLWQDKQIEAARTTLKQGIESFPDSDALPQSLAKTYEAARRWDDARITLLEYLHNHPEDWNMVQEIGGIDINQQQYARALDRLQTIPESSRDARTYYLLGKASSGVGLQMKAIAFYQKSLKKDPHFFRAKAELAYLYEVQKKYVEAIKIYEELASQGENGPQLLLTMIRLHLKLNAPDKAFALTKQGTPSQEFLIEAAGLFLDQQFYEYAASILEPLASQPDLPATAWFSLALLAYNGQQNPQQAEIYLAHIPEDDLYFERALMFRTEILYGLKQYSKAIELTRQGTKLFPNQPKFMLLQASLLKETDQWQQAADILNTALKKWPKNIDILFSLGVLWDEQGDKVKSMEYMEKIISIDPGYPEALNYLGYSLTVLEKNLDRAEVLVKNALQAEPENGYYLDSLAWVFYKKGELDKAWQAIQRAVTLAKKDPTIWEHYGIIAKALGKQEEAKKGINNAKRFKKKTILKPSPSPSLN
ncbi:MAG: tetratricopeptide repeat protein [Desulfoplanes sp.]